MRINDIMTKNPEWCTPETVTTKAAQIMKEKNFGVIPVIESQTVRRLVGVVTDRDLCLTVVAGGLHPDSVLVREAMTSNIVACRPGDEVGKAADSMQENQIRRVPVIDDKGMLLGMVSTSDILQRSDLSSATIHETLKKVSEPTSQASRPRAQMPRAA